MSTWVSRLLKSRTDAPPAGDTATHADIAACFRLLLGRAPNPEELVGHLAQAGQKLDRVVAGYVNSLEFSNRGLFQGPAARPQLVALDGYSLYADEADPAVGRHIAHGDYEPEVAAIFRKLLRPGMGVVDLGANMGYFAMLAAHLVGPDGHVLAIEPNPDNVRLLEASRRLNAFEYVVIAQVAAGRSLGVLALNATHSNGTTSVMREGIDAILTARTVPCVPLDVLVDPDRRINLVKIDVEGAEYNALLGAQKLLGRDRPTIISEFSPGLLTGISGIDGPGFLTWIVGLGYDIAVIQPDGTLSDPVRAPAPVMAAYERRGVDHIDLLFTPRASAHPSGHP